MALIGWIIGAFSWAIAVICILRLRQWDRHLRRARIAIAYKGKVKMSPPLIDWFHWSLAVEKDKQVKGRSVYKMGGTTVAILKPLPKEHGKTETKTVSVD